MTRKLKETMTRWAIKSNETDIDGKAYNGFTGTAYFDRVHSLPWQFHTALFLTRRDARTYMRAKVKQSFPNAQVVRVKVTVSEI